MSGPSQTLRVRDQLRIGPVTMLDFDRQPAIDGGNRITRLARCIGVLKDRGYSIDSEIVSIGDARVARYTLIAEPEHVPLVDALDTAQECLKAAVSLPAAPVADTGEEQGALFELADPRSRSQYEQERAA